MTKVCLHCHVAVLEPHPTLAWWVKCPCCGFCEFDLELIHPDNRAKAEENKMAEKD